MSESSVNQNERAALPKPEIVLPLHGPPFQRPAPDLITQLRQVSTATASAMLHKMGIRQTFILGPVSRQAGAKVVGPAVTLQSLCRSRKTSLRDKARRMLSSGVPCGLFWKRSKPAISW